MFEVCCENALGSVVCFGLQTELLIKTFHGIESTICVEIHISSLVLMGNCQAVISCCENLIYFINDSLFSIDFDLKLFHFVLVENKSKGIAFNIIATTLFENISNSITSFRI